MQPTVPRVTQAWYIACESEEFRTRLYAAIDFRTRFPGRLVRSILTPIALRIFRQDASILREQTNAIRRFGGEHSVSTEIDILGLQILRLLKRAEQGPPELYEDSDSGGWSREIPFEA